MGVTQRGALVHHVGATLLRALGSFGPNLQGLDQVFFLICHNEAVLGVGEGAEGLNQILLPGPMGPYLCLYDFIPSVLLGFCCYSLFTFLRWMFSLLIFSPSPPRLHIFL